MNKSLKTVWNVVTWILIFCVVILAILLAGVRVAGLTPFSVLSGSMEPSYHVGSLIYVKSVEPEKIAVGDAITYVLNKDLVVATHRVIEIDTENRYFYTKGDANEIADASPVVFENLIGKPVFTIPLLGYFSSWITQPPGLYIGICAAVILLILFYLPNLLDKAEEADKKQREKKSQNENQ